MKVGKPRRPKTFFVIHQLKKTLAVRNRKSMAKVAIRDDLSLV